MDYKDIRTKFATISGRYDLITSTYEDNGADFFLNAGQRYLDRLLDSGKMEARYPVAISAGTYIAKTVDIRAIREVWLANSEGKFQLTPVTMNELLTEYDEGFSNVAQGTPAYCAPVIFRPAPDTLASSTGMYEVGDLLLYDATSPAKHFNYNGVVIMPPPDGAYTLEIVGLFYSPTLSATLSGAVWTQTKSFWSEIHPDVLIEAALFKLNGFYQNDSGATLSKGMLVEDILGIDHDLVENELAGSLQMNG